MKKLITIIALAVLATYFQTAVSAQIIRTAIGNNTAGHTGDGGPAIRAEIGNSISVVQDYAGNYYLSDDGSNCIRKITPSGIITTIAGTGYPGYTGDGGAATSARLNYPSGLAFDKAGNLYFVDNGNFAVRKITPTGIISTVVGDGSGTHAHAGDGGPATNARLAGCIYLAFDSTGNMYITDGNTRIRKVDTAGIINTIAGGPYLGYSGNGVQATSAVLSGPSGIVLDTAGNIYFSDASNMIVRKITPTGVISNVAGTPNRGGFTGDGGAATNARLNGPGGLAMDAAGNLYIADQGNFRIRVVNTSGVISTYAGNGAWAYAGDGGHPVAASMKFPTSICFGNNNNVLITDRRNFVVREIRNQVIRTISASAGVSTCAGTMNIFYVPVPNHDLGIINQWSVNGHIVGSDSNAFATGSLVNGDVVSFKTIDPIGGFTIDSSYPLTVHISPLVTPSVTISKNTTDTVCSGTPVTFTAHPVNGGGAPSYIWLVNGTRAATSPTFTYAPSPSHIVTAQLTSSEGCTTVNPVTSAAIRMHVLPGLVPALTIASSATGVCAGTRVSYNALGINAGVTPVYTWKRSGTTVGTGSSFTYAPSNGDILQCELTSSAACALAATATSSVTNLVYPTITPSISIVAAPGEEITNPGQLVTFYSEVTYGGPAVTYQWFLNGNIVSGATSNLFSTNAFANDSVRCMITSTAPCVDNPVKNSNLIIIKSPELSTSNILHSEGGIKIYPNPNNGNFSITGKVNSGTDAKAAYHVFDITGKEVLRGELTIASQTINEMVALNGRLDPGQYIMKINTQKSYELLHFIISQ